ncbi:hypothetical protein SELMODRAFT_113284 [Selaginella moellendorffii]|uniref:Enhancer of rudimentary homolog n=1 Tax=Selaginella moellendorffii TaxID=88036 RepID=D8SC84_SELML|nr:enhancer of rudimentary homolog [Selaginella moellendorffii]EFJ09615.1 hypothetical protein SELMODRAFT_129603 [Selaginella moellendorffii]EFJ18147.1 hypothetical protein SELMODRAFT_113284 [Selaginella moellendorffii]|eukprot:XP_002980962.1 enhancer of rudimentary homolog [Selaginella moellendorffii]
MSSKKKILLLVQQNQNQSSRTYLEFDSIPLCMEGVCAMYEKKLKDLNPELTSICYDIGDLYDFIDGLKDISALVYDPNVHGFLPYDRQWIKHRSFQHLRKLAAPVQKDIK